MIEAQWNWKNLESPESVRTSLHPASVLSGNRSAAVEGSATPTKLTLHFFS